MEILCFNELESTQIYLIEKIKNKTYFAPLAIMAKEQTKGVGSRDNSWEGGKGNLFFSVAIRLEDLPKDLPLNSASIYFSFIMKQVLLKYTDDIWLKWPNDLYHNNSKIAGTITKKNDNILFCGMGINLQKNSNSFEALNIDIEPLFLLKKYLCELEEYPSWKQIFSQYRIEFDRSKEFFTHINNKYKSLENAILSEDGSLIIDNKRVYSIR
ncbi:Biotin-protein ligase [hydrothermal vent metagenome]|uniref:Biotin-protein ligase n=1 Tax=hydrothermal vent metagenome TaxID=652676 RepID=A0A1W1CUW3_9ZZZZ